MSSASRTASSSSSLERRRTKPKLPPTALLESLLSDMEGLCEDEETADMEFVVGSRKERVRAHTLVVLTRCHAYRKRKEEWLRRGGGGDGPVSIRLPHYDVKPVRSVVRHLYTGKINLRKEDVFQVLSLCSSEFGLPALRRHCIQHIGDSLSAGDVCAMMCKTETMLAGCTAEGVVASLQEILARCLAFVEENTKAVFQSGGFTELSKDLLVSILSRDKLSVPEEDVWRGVLAWGVAGAGVQASKDSLQWSEGERQRIRAALDGVLTHVRVMEINSEVFAKEVEPTGLLPIEMTLARYRHAAVHGKRSGSSSDQSSRPRSGVQDPLPDSQVLEGRTDLQLQLHEWCVVEGGELDWVLLYRASRDGFEANAFHSCCDDKGPTLVLVKNPSGYVFGGFTDVSWSSRFKRGKYSNSHKAFLFSLLNPSNSQPMKFAIKQPSYAINNHPSNGPIFGSGADLYISSDCNSNKDSYSQLPYSYGEPSTAQQLLTGEQYFVVEDYEVFGVSR